MCHPVLRGLQVRAARPCLRDPGFISKPFPSAVAMQGRSPLGQLPATCHRLGKSPQRGWGLSQLHPPHRHHCGRTLRFPPSLAHLFHLPHRSFCWEHRPQQAVHARPSQDNTCTICLDTVENRISYKTMGCPACQDARFHRQCVQRLALHAGIGFRCPCCLNQEPFMMEMLTMGIRLSKRPPSWESVQAVTPLGQRHGRCDAETCLCPGGREHAEEAGPWQLRLCSSCAAEGTHRHCSSLGNSTYSWECHTCAGTETGRHQSTRCPALGTGARLGLAAGPSARLGSRTALATTGASPAYGLRGHPDDLAAPLRRLHWQTRACQPQHFQPGIINALPGCVAPQQHLLPSPSAGLEAALP
ncbi:PREDICTED: G2/M phase-specific E3 ubiquitin-protein ligase isoform X1 [Corvus brachyrhynchos]|uniref:G2/M phase-specific E3 ubiquitin-protein ligase isoform X1 n=1 Tax=Corvus brachyrhynchos TaxID=85066 RepID=UPI0008164FD2|nr:PREDICTED: G2/M phase-specific E3 ubiquitin-protein ligase isoform X1 [Corvus brachyrhynchos]